jgi:hypothetical protein
MFKYTIIVGFVALIVFFYDQEIVREWFKINFNLIDSNNEKLFRKTEIEVIKSWQNKIFLPNRSEKVKIVVGLNTNVDLILSATSLFNELNINSNKQNDIAWKNHHKLNNLNEFKECFINFFKKGSAAERSFTNLDSFNKVLKAAENLKQKDVKKKKTSFLL